MGDFNINMQYNVFSMGANGIRAVSLNRGLRLELNLLK